MKKFLLIALVVLVLLGVGLWFYADSAVEAAVERGGTYALGVETDVGGASLGLFAGTFGIADLTVANPEGFDDDFLSMGAFDVKLDTGSVFSDTIIVPEILLENIDIRLMQTSDGSNYGKILEHLEKFESGKPSTDDTSAPSDGGGKSVNIGRIRIRNVNAIVDVSLGGTQITHVDLTVPEILLEEVEDGLTVSQIFDLTIKTLLSAVLEGGADLLPADLLADLGGNLDKLADVPMKLAGDVVGETTKLAEDAAKEAEKAVTGAVDQAEKAAAEFGDKAKGVLDAFGGKKDDKKR